MNTFPDNYDDMFDEILNMDLYQQKTDIDPKILAKKEVGDIITIIDYSAVSDENGTEIEDDVINTDDEFIVIEINQKHLFKTIYVTYTQDLLVINRRTKIKYRTPFYYTRIN